MRVQVLFFGRLKDIVGRAEESAELPEGSRVEDVFALYRSSYPALAGLRPSVTASVNQELAEWKAALRAGDEVAFLPPVSGGSVATASRDWIEIVHNPICAEPIVNRVKGPEEGAVVVFDGIVRNRTGGRRTLYLDYEAYEPMALEKLRELTAALRARYSVSGVAMVHRLGRLEIGETSVLIAVSAPHRAVAFDACRFAIEMLKRSVPIWKKEYLADGAVWAEGEALEPIPGPGPKRP
ncbi:MAG TPA: molybdenum cofactor biosynthesis protein MoaE [Candidatus Acidoferrales bacterium]|nr:molybdenum cofactor biosynthesis protein MoaE [Candidatus Acidoferrales bacterium]